MPSNAQTRGKITETELQIIQIDQDLASEVTKELRETDAKIGEFVERKVGAEDQLAASTSARRRTASCTSRPLTPSAASSPRASHHADRAAERRAVGRGQGQSAGHRQAAGRPEHAAAASAFNQRTTPEVNGGVTRVSPDVTTDQRTGQSYYTIRVSMAPEEVARLGEVKIIPGMPVEAFVQTGDRTMISYLMKPLSDQLKRSFRER